MGNRLLFRYKLTFRVSARALARAQASAEGKREQSSSQLFIRADRAVFCFVGFYWALQGKDKAFLLYFAIDELIFRLVKLFKLIHSYFKMVIDIILSYLIEFSKIFGILLFLALWLPHYVEVFQTLQENKTTFV